VQAGERVDRSRTLVLIGLQCPGDPWGCVVEGLHQLHPRCSNGLASRREPYSYGPYRLLVALDGQQQNRSGASPPVCHNSTQGIAAGDVGFDRSLGDLRQLAFGRKKRLEQPPVSPARDPNDTYTAGIHGSDDDLGIERPLQLVRETESHASHRLQAGFLGLRLSEGDNVWSATDPIQQTAQVILDPNQVGGLEALREQQPGSGTPLRMEDQHSAF
jgi:hypothetical protein